MDAKEIAKAWAEDLLHSKLPQSSGFVPRYRDAEGAKAVLDILKQIEGEVSNPPVRTREFDSATAALDALVNSFAEAMKAKLHQKEKEGRSGWDDPRNWQGIKRAIVEHAERGDGQWVDVANFAAMLWNFEEMVAFINEP